MAQIRIKVGAALDPGALAIFAPFVAKSRQATAQIAAEGKKAAKEYVGGYRTAPAEAKASFDAIAKGAEHSDAAILRSAVKLVNDRRRLRDQDLRDSQRAQKEDEARNKRVISSAGRAFGGIASRVGGAVGGAARAIGVQMDPNALLGKVVGQHAAATNISNAGYLEGASGAAGQRQDPGKIVADARRAGDAAAISADVALEGLQKFTDKTTDLETGRAILERMAKLSKETGSDMGDVMDAAGSISVKLGDIPDKAGALASIMSVVAKQGKIGSVSMAAMSSQISGIIGPANQFAEGTGKAVVELGALFQLTNKFGGLKGGPAAAATATASFAGDLTSKAGLKSMHAAGVKDDQIFADKGRTKLKSLGEIVPMLIEKTGGDLTKIAGLFTNKRSAAVAKAMAGIYSDAEGKQKGSGAAAVGTAITSYSGGTSDKDAADALAAALSTDASKVQLFNNALEGVAEKAAGSLLPALEGIAPAAIAAADVMGKLAGWTAENPGPMIAAAVGLALSKGLGGAIGGALGAGIVVTTATIAVSQAIMQSKEDADTTYDDKARAMAETTKRIKKANDAGVAPEQVDIDDVNKEIADAKGRLGNAKANTPDDPFDERAKRMGQLGGIGSGILNTLSGGRAGESFGDQASTQKDVENQAAIAKQLAETTKVMSAVHKALTGKLNVHVANMPGNALAGPGPGATTGPAPVRE